MGMLIRAFQNRNASFTRWLGLLLVVFILYGTTVEAAHRHGRVLTTTGAALVDSDQTKSPVSSKPGCSDCLICQLHQNFSTTLIAFRLVAPPKQVRIKIPPPVSPDLLSQLVGPTPGRAPPSLS